MKTITSIFLLITLSFNLLVGQVTQSQYGVAPSLETILPTNALWGYDKDVTRNQNYTWDHDWVSSADISFSKNGLDKVDLCAVEVVNEVPNFMAIESEMVGDQVLGEPWNIEVKEKVFITKASLREGSSVRYSTHFSLRYNKENFEVFSNLEADDYLQATKAFNFIISANSILEMKNVIRHILLNLEFAGFEISQERGEVTMGRDFEYTTEGNVETKMVLNISGQKVADSKEELQGLPAGYYILTTVRREGLESSKFWHGGL